MLVNLFPPKGSLKNIIINILLFSSETPNKLSVENIRKQIKKHHNHSFTYQGINKILHALKEEKIIIRNEQLWSINEEWSKTIGTTLSKYDNREKIPIYNSDMRSISFSTIGEAFEFMIENIKNDTLRTEGERIFITHVRNIAFFSLDKEYRDFLRRFSKDTKCYVLVQNNNFINRFLAKYFKSLGWRVYLDIPRSTPHTITVYGNTLYNTFSNADLIDYMTSAYNKVKSITNVKALKVYDSLKDDQRFPIMFTFETDNEAVNQTKEFLLDLVEKNKSKAL
ncbi:hypothetical protein ACFL0W_00675 [Nanoarchaeota archaeon]